MAAPMVEINSAHPNPRHLARAISLLVEGELVAYPTDTLYGIGCDSGSKRAIERLQQLKGGKKAHTPLSFLCADLSDVAKYANVTNFAYRILKHHTPGPFTFILEATRLVPELTMTRQKHVGIRIPDDPIARALAQGLNRPLVSTSAASVDGEPLDDARDIKEHWGDWLALILDAGPRVSEPSTIVSLVDGQVTVLREGKGIL